MADKKTKSEAENTNPTAPRCAQDGLVMEQAFASEGEHPFDECSWELRTAKITDEKGEAIFEQNDVEVPTEWSQMATKVVVSKYFYGENGTPARENSIRQLVHRVTRTISDWGKEDGVFASDADAERFYNDLTWLCVNQYGAFNSPVWFNVGLFHQNGVTGGGDQYHWSAEKEEAIPTNRGYEYPQASACFIQSVKDTMDDIMDLAKKEAMLFKHGSGTGTDMSTLRSSYEKLSGGGTPSGPLSFMRVYDQVAAVIKSGGKTRRAAKMQSLRCDHPDIEEFITAKTTEEKKAWALIEQGYDGSFGGEAYESVMFQNANLSVRLTDEFLQAAEDDADWQTQAITDSTDPMPKYKARDLLNKIAIGTHVCGDPGVQYHTTINEWHTCPESGPINASNPCSEYMFVNDSACNLASLNLMKFRNADGSLQIERFRAAVRVFIIAQEILIDHASYPSPEITKNSHDFRPLGLGYANLGALLMSLGLPYDSGEGRALAGSITAIMTGSAYATSAELASRVGTFPEFYKNREPMLGVMEKHRDAVDAIDADLVSEELLAAAKFSWDEAREAGERHGYRNAQVTVLAPTGTIGFMMDCDTTGVEPDIALVKYKNLAGGGLFKIVNQTVPQALERLGYASEQIAELLTFIDEHDTIEGAPHLKEEHLSVFDCAFKAAQGSRCIHYMGHIRMMAAAQPFLSGAISKTVNMPTEATPEEIQQVYVEGWKLGVKAIAIYRDGSKRIQPLNTSMSEPEAEAVEAFGFTAEDVEKAKRSPHRRRLPATRPSITHKFDVAGHEGYITIGLYDDGMPGEVFVSMAKEGSTVGGMMDVFATGISLCLQYGVPLKALVKKFTHQRFEPSGMTSNRNIPFAKSIVDYIFRWLEQTFLEEGSESKPKSKPAETPGPATKDQAALPTSVSTGSEAVKDDLSSDTRGNQTPRTESRGSVAALLEPATATAMIAAAPRTNRMAQGRVDGLDQQFSHFQSDAPPCPGCGSITVRNGNCYKCHNCGSSLGCS